jgi:hypothetical protein
MEQEQAHLSDVAFKVLLVLGEHGSASQSLLRRRISTASPNALRKGLAELDRAGLASSFFGGNVLTARGRRRLHALREQRRRERIRGGTASPHEVSLLADPEMRAAVRRIKPRADRETDARRLTATFVDPGISEQLDNPNNQIIFGRRGTGKTHVLRVVHDLLSSVNDALVVYVDLRTLGSSTVFEDTDRPLDVRATSLIKDVFEPLHSALLDRATGPSARDFDFTSLDALADAITRSILANEKHQVERHRDVATRDSLTAALTAKPPFFELSGTGTADTKTSSRVAREGNPLESLLFAQVAGALADSLASTEVDRLYLLLDEWTAIPEDLQPHLAEFLKRSLFVVPTVTVKIAALEYRSVFAEPAGRNNVVGFELGADISSNLELDDYFVFDRNNAQTEDVFAEVLFRHVSAEIAHLRRDEGSRAWQGGAASGLASDGESLSSVPGR